jgi:hypothetical protein
MPALDAVPVKRLHETEERVCTGKKPFIRKSWNLVDMDDSPTSGKTANEVATNDAEIQHDTTERAKCVLIIDDSLSIR